MASKHDMFRYGLIHFDICEYKFYSHLVTGGGGGVDFGDKCHRNQFRYGLQLHNRMASLYVFRGDPSEVPNFNEIMRNRPKYTK